jgi:glycosyltransferase involved in cell wall biosynthesis
MHSELRITIAICTYNRAGYLKDTLEDLTLQDISPSLFEILVVNNNSSDGTDTVCEIFSRTNPQIQFRWVQEPHQGLSHARNKAAKEARAQAIHYIDDDVYLPNDFVRTAIMYADKRESTICAGGRILVSFDDKEKQPDWIPGELMPMFGLHDLGKHDMTYPSGNFPRGGNMMIRKTVFDAFGYFDTQLGRSGNKLLGSEEKAFFERIRKNGVQLHYWAGLQLTHRIGNQRLEKEYLKKQSVGIGRSERLRVREVFTETAAKFAGELIKLAGSFLIAAMYMIRGKVKAAVFLIQFRFWVLKGFLKGDKDDDSLM